MGGRVTRTRFRRYVATLSMSAPFKPPLILNSTLIRCESWNTAGWSGRCYDRQPIVNIISFSSPFVHTPVKCTLNAYHSFLPLAFARVSVSSPQSYRSIIQGLLGPLITHHFPISERYSTYPLRPRHGVTRTIFLIILTYPSYVWSSQPNRLVSGSGSSRGRYFSFLLLSQHFVSRHAPHLALLSRYFTTHSSRPMYICIIYAVDFWNVRLRDLVCMSIACLV